MPEDKAGLVYWKSVWTDEIIIQEIDYAFSSNLLYFNKYYINGFDDEKSSVLKTQERYDEMGYTASIYHRDFFSTDEAKVYDVVSSFRVFEHFENLASIMRQTKKYLKENRIVGFLQEILNKKVYDIHISYTKDEILETHEKGGYKTLFCGYQGLYQSGVINISSIKNESIIRKILALPGKPLYFLSKLLHWNFSNKLISPHIIDFGKISV